MAKSLEDKLSQAVKAGDSLVVDLARRNVEREAIETSQRSCEMQHVVARGRSTKVPLSAYRIGQVPLLRVAEADKCEGLITECEVCDALKQVGLNTSPGLIGLPYEVYLRLPHMFVPILTAMVNHWFALGAIPVSVTKGVIRLLKKDGRHVWDDLGP